MSMCLDASMSVIVERLIRAADTDLELASALRCVQWMYSSPGFSRPARPSSISRASVALLTPCETVRTPTSRASTGSTAT